MLERNCPNGEKLFTREGKIADSSLYVFENNDRVPDWHGHKLAYVVHGGPGIELTDESIKTQTRPQGLPLTC
jgi:hypothetical protein